MTQTNSIDYVVPAGFTVPQNGKVSITVNDYTRLIVDSKEYTVGSGKNQMTYSIVHTNAGYISLNRTKSGAQAEWMADDFTITAVYSDEKGNHSFSFDHDGKRSELPFQAIIPKNIDTSLYDKGVAVNTKNKAHEAFSHYLQGLLNKFTVQDAKTLIGWNMKKGQLKWMGANLDPPLLKYHNSCGSEAAYIEQLGGLMSDCPPLQFVTCSAAASTLLAYLRLILKIQISTFGISIKNTSSKGKSTAQIACISEYAETHNMEVEHWYIDMAKTGRNTKRPEYQRMKQDIENGNVEGKVILVRAIDRMHRNAKNQLVDADWCKKLGVRIIGITDGIDTAAPNGKFAMTIKAATAEEYSDIIAINTRAGQLEAALECKHLGGTPPLGYKVNSEGTYDIDETTAPIIRDIFKLYLQDIGYSNIISYLKRKGYKTVNGNDFSKASLNAILRNPKYMGTYTFDRTPPKDSEGKRNSHKAKEKYTIIENGMPAIIKADDFKKVQAKMAANAGKHAQRASSNYYALKGKIKCANCGKAITGNVNHSKDKKYYQYRCTCNCKLKPVSVKRMNDVTSQNIIKVKPGCAYGASRFFVLIAACLRQ